jgi:hypothetical protein
MPDFPTHETEHICPGCGKVNDRASSTDPNYTRPPQSGDLVVCFRCGHVSVVDEDKLRSFTTDELRELQREFPDIWAVINRASRSIRLTNPEGGNHG